MTESARIERYGVASTQLAPSISLIARSDDSDSPTLAGTEIIITKRAAFKKACLRRSRSFEIMAKAAMTGCSAGPIRLCVGVVATSLATAYRPSDAWSDARPISSRSYCQLAADTSCAAVNHPMKPEKSRSRASEKRGR